MTDTTRLVIKEVIAKMRASTPIGAICGDRIYTRAPDNPTFPFVRITTSQSPFDTKTKTGMQHILQITAFDRSADPERAVQLREEIYNLLHRQENTFTTVKIGSIIFTGVAPVFLDPDGASWNAVAQFEIKVLEE